MTVTERESGPYVGLITPAGDSVMEGDLHRLCPTVRLCTTRMALDNVSAEAEVRMVREELPRAAQLLTCLPLDVLIFGCTSASVAGGDNADEDIRATIRDITGAQPLTVFGAVCDQLRRIAPSNLLCITPYPEELTAQLCHGLEMKGFHVAGSVSMGLHYDRDIGRVTPDQVEDIVRRHWSVEYDALFLSCTTLRAAEVAPGLERELGVPVVTSNLAVARQLGELWP